MIEKQYSVGIRKRVNSDRFFQHSNFVFTEVKINTHGRYWFADPFLFEKEGVTYLFYEAFDLVIQKGYIGYSIIHDNGMATDPKMIIRRKFHHSFPFIFEKNGEIYIMPESCSEYNIRLFRATEFPNHWTEDKVLVSDFYGADTIKFNYRGKEFLLSSQQYLNPPKDKVASCWVRNRLYTLDGINITDPAGIIVSEGDRGIRNAGAIFDLGEKLIRPGQYSVGGIYGKGLTFFEIESVEPYKEKIIYEIDCHRMQNHVEFGTDGIKLVGVHTYNASAHYEVIDLSYYKSLAAQTVFFRSAYTFLKQSYHSLKDVGKISARIMKKLVKKTMYKENTYQSVIDKDAPWVFVSYIADAFYHKNDDAFLNAHQNKREVLAMSDIFNKLGYNAYFMLYTSNSKLPDIDCKLIFGHEPGLQRAKKKYPNAKMVFYGVSTYYKYRNEKIKLMTDNFNKSFNSSVPYRRLVEPHTAFLEADSALLIGSEITKNTYPIKDRNKITKIHQSTQECKYLKNVDACGSKEFFYLASTGNILKGIQALVEFFSSHQEYILHWVGPIEDDVKDAIKSKLTPNIVSYGFQDIGSPMVLGLMERCDFVIYPSGVEGVPGSVLNAMKSGLIPLVTPWASFDGINQFGFLMKDANEESVSDAINWAMSLTMEDIDRRKKACQRYVLDTFNLKRFSEEFEVYMKGILNND